MSYKIVVDSCCELEPEHLAKPEQFESVPLTLEVDEFQIVDDETFDQIDFLQKVADCVKCPRSACPSPDAFLEAYKADVDHIFVVTLSSKLSGSYNSAMVAKDMYEEDEVGTARIHVVDSETASCGELQIVEELVKLEEQGLDFDTIVERIEAFRSSIHTYFVLESLEVFRKNGRLTGLKEVIVSTLNIKPVLAGKQGEIVQKGQGIGIRKALDSMVDILVKETKDVNRTLMIAHCNAPVRAAQIRDKVLAKVPFAKVVIIDTRGVSSLYASDGGVIVTI